MGLIRLLLAVTVVINHAGPLYGLVFTDAYIAIKIFFIISGFYMTLILSEKYSGPGSYALFLSNRFLRLFPTYWFVLLLSVLASLAFKLFQGSSLVLGPWFHRLSELDPVAALSLVVANLTILGQDLLFFSFISPETGSFVFSSQALLAPLPAWYFLVIPQAWTLALELMFYAMAPFLVKRRLGVIALVIAVCFAFRAMISFADLPFDPWRQRFFPAELGFFLLGVVSYAVYAKIRYLSPPPPVQAAITVLYLAALLGYQFLPGSLVKEFFIYAATVFSLPFIFNFTKKMKWDRMIGELSYPIYISHWTIIMAARSLFGEKHLSEISVAGSILFCVLLNRFFADRIEIYRQKRVYASQ